MRIAMWSGPRNLSTAMMYAFASRGDCAIVDEPFYAAYLDQTGLDHPMRDEILASQSRDPEDVAKALTGPIPGGKPHFYQKHMTQHMIGAMPRGWMGEMRHVFLIRHPARVIASFSAKYGDMTLEDIGFPQQSALFDTVRDQGADPIVVDSHDIRANPRVMLEKLCDALGLAFESAMLGWEKGGHPDDGVWAAHWYKAVHNSTGFAGAEGPLPDLEPRHQDLARAALPHYERLRAVKLE